MPSPIYQTETLGLDTEGSLEVGQFCLAGMATDAKYDLASESF